MMRSQIQNHDIAISRSPDKIHAIFIRLQKDLEVLSQG